jgi:hypothetical protein
MKRKFNSFSKRLFLNGVDCSLLRTTTTTSTTEMPTTTSTTEMPTTTVAEEASTTSEVPSPPTTTSDWFSSSEDTTATTYSSTIFDDELSTTEGGTSTEVIVYFYTTESNDMNFYRIVTTKLHNEEVYWMLSFGVVTILVLCAFLSYCSRETKKGVYHVPNTLIVDFEMTEELRV